jgi:hypothetical protein
MLTVLINNFGLIISASFKISGFNISANIDLDIVQSPKGYTSLLLIVAFGVVCYM